jgi:hypothetical protein
MMEISLKFRFFKKKEERTNVINILEGGAELNSEI